MDNGACILLVDQDMDLRRAAARLLREAGHQVLEAATGRDGLQRAREEKPDLILLEVGLPDLDGVEVCRQIKADAHLAHSHVVLLSQTGLEDQANGLKAGADGYLPRPASSRELLARVQVAVRLKRTEDALQERTRQLEERVKELACLYGIAQLREQPSLTLEEILQGTVDLIRASWQYPEVTCARILLQDQEYKTANFQPTAWRQACDILVWGAPAGRVEVTYLEERPEHDEGPFLAEERALLQAIAERLGRVIERVRMEAALREAEERYRTVSDLTSDLAYAFRVEAGGTLVRDWVTEAFSRLMDSPPDSLAAGGPSPSPPDPSTPRAESLRPQAYPWVVVHPDDLLASRHHMETLLAGQQHTCELRIVTSAGQVRWLRDYGRPVWDEAQGRVVRIYGAAQDITERKRAEEALARSRAEFEAIFHSISDAILFADTDRRIVMANPAFTTLFGYELEEAKGKTTRFLYESQADYEEQGRRRYQVGIEPENQPFEIRYRRKDGSLFTAESLGIQVQDAQGEIIGFVGVHRDITERKQAEEALAKNTHLLETILDHTHMLIAYLDPEFNFVRVNRDYARADDREPSFFPGKNHFDLYPNAENEEIFRRVVETGEAYLVYAKPFEYPEHPERGVSYWDWSLVPIKDAQGTIIGLVLTLANVTERVQAQQQLTAALAEKETLLKEIHHRVKNNLQLISAMLALQARATEDERVTLAFEESQHRILSMAGIHEQLYRSRDLSQVDMAAYLRDLADELQRSYGRPAVSIHAEAADVRLDVDQAIPCGLIVNELVSNALKHAFPADGPQSGEVWVRMQSHPVGDPPASVDRSRPRAEARRVELSVSDNGVGLQADLDFEQTKTLGLTMVGLLSHQLGGALEVSRKDGTTLRITFDS